MAERTPRTPEQKAASAAKAKETRARNKKVKSAANYVSSNSVDAGLTAEPMTTFGSTPTPIRGSEAIEQEAARRKTEYEGIQARKAERAESGFMTTKDRREAGQYSSVRTTSEGLPFGRSAGTTSTRGHSVAPAHVAQLESTASALGASTSVRKEVAGQIRGLSNESPVVPPSPRMIGRGDNRRQVLYTNEYDRSAPTYTGQTVGSGAFGQWGVGGRPDLLDTIQSYQQIATPGFSRGDRTAGSQGDFSGMNPAELENAVKAEVLPDRISSAISGLMKPSNYSRAPKIQKPWGVGSSLTPSQREAVDTVTVSEGGRTTRMTQAEHQERAENKIAKRKKAEGEAP